MDENGCTDGTDRETRCGRPGLCVFGYGWIDAQHNLQSGILDVSSCFERIWYFCASESPMRRGESILIADIISELRRNGWNSHTANVIESGLYGPSVPI